MNMLGYSLDGSAMLHSENVRGYGVGRGVCTARYQRSIRFKIRDDRSVVQAEIAAIRRAVLGEVLRDIRTAYLPLYSSKGTINGLVGVYATS